jgi:hypothetical protein
MADDLPTLLRLKGVLDAAAQMPPDDIAAPALTDSYTRLRGQVRDLAVSSASVSTNEFDALFPELPTVTLPRRLDMLVEQGPKLEANAKHASLLLRQLGGWVDGVIATVTFTQRLDAEARAKAELSARLPTGLSEWRQAFVRARGVGATGR